MADLLLCPTCGTQFDIQFAKPLSNCRICDDPRQYVPADGQKWTSLANERGKHENKFQQSSEDSRIWFITSEPKLGIGQRCILLCTPAGNVLWDLIAYLDEATIKFISSRGGLAAIVISHPHFYTTHLDWAEAFGCPVYTAAEDAQWLCREDVGGVRRRIDEPTKEIVPKVTAIKVGGHFDGSMVLHWGNKIFTADSVMVVPSGVYHVDRPHGTTSFAFMWSYPNMIPLTPRKIQDIWKALKPYAFKVVHGGFPGQDVRSDEDLRKRLLESMKIQIRAAGHDTHALLQEASP